MIAADETLEGKKARLPEVFNLGVSSRGLPNRTAENVEEEKTHAIKALMACEDVETQNGSTDEEGRQQAHAHTRALRKNTHGTPVGQKQMMETMKTGLLLTGAHCRNGINRL